MSGALRSCVVSAVFFCGVIAQAGLFTPFLVNGTVANPSDWGMVVSISSDRPSKCTGVVIGPRTIITSAACNKAGGKATFTAGGTTYTATMTLSSLWPKQEHDLALGITDKDITGVTPATIGGTVSTGLGVTNLGYGCTDADGTVFDGQLRMGAAAVTDTKDLYVVTGGGANVSNASYVCYYDNGGPAFVAQSNSHTASPTLLAVNSFGDRKSKNYAIRLDIQQSKDFFSSFIAANGNAEICGINGTQAHCAGGGPTPGAPTCNLVASPPQVVVGGNVTIVLTTQNATGATLDGQPVAAPGGSKTIPTSTVGQGHSHADVTGAGGSGSCDVTYTVTPTPVDPGNAPTCTITALPQSVSAGDPVTLTLTVTSGTADLATIDGVEVPRPVGTKVVKQQNKGDYSVTGFVKSNANGARNCYGWYHVDDNSVNPNIPNFAVIPSYCGDNTANSDVRQVCLGVVKKDTTITNLRFSQALYVTYKNNTQEAMPILARVTAGAGHALDGTVQETLELYPGGTVPAGDYQALDMREATLTSAARRSVRDSSQPMSIIGYTATGQGFNVPSLNALGYSARRPVLLTSRRLP